MELAVLFSGGKDSCLALHKAMENNKVLFLLSVIPANIDSFMFHKPDEKLLKKQAEMLNIKLIIEKSKGEKDKELKDLEKLIKKVKNKIQGIVVGGLASNYQGDRIKKICKKYNLKFIAPLWDYSPEKLWKELFNSNFKVILTKISSDGIPKESLGKTIDEKEYEKLKNLSEKYKFRLDFEGGEAESAVLYMPEFKNEISLDFDIKSEDKYRHFIKIKKIK